MHQEKYSLTWHTYSDHLRSMMKELMMNEDFSDVTLVTEDKKHIKANINILSTCSPVFKDILKKEKNSNQIMYLRGVQFSEMESIMQFIYLGEATYYQERMEEFLAVGKSLEIKELCNADTNTEVEFNECLGNQSLGIRELCNTKSNYEIELDDKPVQTLISDNVIEQGVVVSENRKYKCDQCHKNYSQSRYLQTHKKTAHQGFKYACNQCTVGKFGG